VVPLSRRKVEILEAKTLEDFLEDLSALIRARYPLIYLQSFEEQRCLELLEGLGSKRECVTYVWSRTKGVSRGLKSVSDIKDPMAILGWYEELSEKSVLILKDFHPYMKEPAVVRKLRDLSHSLKRSQKNIIFLSPVLQLPPELAKEIVTLEMPLPSREEIAGLVKKAATALPKSVALAEDEVERLIDAACGLTFDEIENVLAKSMVSKGSIDQITVQNEKKQTVKKSGLLEFLNTQGSSLPTIGGLLQLKEWLKTRRNGFSSEARAINLPLPKGILLVGIPGCGKSLTAMTVGREWQLPLLRLDMGKIFSGIVGSSEGNIRNAIQTCEAVAPCILWIDEIEKGLSGTQSSGSSDGGTTSRVFGTILTWMQEKKSAVFVVATANDISQLPPEFMRKGRFDEIFFVDLPTAQEREDIFKIQIQKFGWKAEDLDMASLLEATDGFSGAEIEQVLISGRYLAFGNGAEFSNAHILEAIRETVPLSKTMGDRIENLRNWAKHRARSASAPEGGTALPTNSFEMRANSLEFRGAQG